MVLPDFPRFLGKEWIGGAFQQECRGRRPESFETDFALLRTTEISGCLEGSARILCLKQIRRADTEVHPYKAD